MLGLLLARAGIPVTVLETHADFLRDFRGDTIRSSTLQILDDLGLVDRMLTELPHSKVSELRFWFPDESLLPSTSLVCRVASNFIASVPQWDFLEFITREASRYTRSHC